MGVTLPLWRAGLIVARTAYVFSPLPGLLIVIAQPVGAVSVPVPRLYDPPVGVDGALLAFW